MPPAARKAVIRDRPPERGVERLFSAAAALAGVCLALAVAGRWLTWPVLRLAPFGFMFGVMVMLVVAMGYIYKAMFAAYWEWFTAAYARNERRAKAQAERTEGQSGPPAA